MRRKRTFSKILIYIMVPLLFLIVIYGIYQTDYSEVDYENNESIYEEIVQIPNSDGNIGEFEYENYIVNEDISIVDLALKLKKDIKILQYNNPKTIKNPILKQGMRIIIYKDSIIFYKIKEGDTLSKISTKFKVSKETIVNLNDNIMEENLENKKYLVIKNPKIDDISITEKGMEELINFVDFLTELNEEKNNEKKLNQDNIQTTLSSINRDTSKTISNQPRDTRIINNNYENNSEMSEVKIIDSKEKLFLGEDFDGEENVKLTISDIKKLDLSKIKSYELFWPVVSTRITSEYGNRMHPILKINKFHRGVDIGAIKGAAVNSGLDGIITYAGKKGNYGNLIEIKRNDGLKVRYAHLSKVEVDLGQIVKMGDKVGEVGSTGLSTGPHLHYEVLIEDIPVDPMRFKYR